MFVSHNHGRGVFVFVLKTLASVKLVTQLDEELYRAARDHYDKVRAVRRLSAEQTVEVVRYPALARYIRRVVSSSAFAVAYVMCVFPRGTRNT